ncbi:MAG: Nif3-like dinuclear metal center hexameric protein [Desulfuromonadaceae bacterium]|nr:Nif3-like dinuclear metal center hexameric protein [Desulfuromonadaceae bacterium]MDD5107452.1 Nif3-like dinuclear metal center hexameric protein [Desulfuromonadaceae bacterium]
MKTPKVADIVGIVNKFAPVVLAEPWDNSGLQVGDPSAEVFRIMVALDPTAEVITSALASSCQLLVTHHPLIFKPLTSISTATPLGALLHTAIKNGLSILSLHTNYDIATGGLNDVLASTIGLPDSVPLKVTSSSELVKLVVFVPAAQLALVRSALFPFAAAQGNYCDCSFSGGGVGTFTPTAGAQPFIGTVGKLSEVSEERLELLVERSRLSRAVRVLRDVHPYEEPAFDLYPLFNEGEKRGLGRIGSLSAPCTLEEYAARIGTALRTPALRYTGDPHTMVTRVALCSGSGASLLHDAVRAGADVLVTGDVKYHDAREAENMGLAFIDAGHFSTEIIMVEEITERFGQALLKAGFKDCQVQACRTEVDPFHLLPGISRTNL